MAKIARSGLIGSGPFLSSERKTVQGILPGMLRCEDQSKPIDLRSSRMRKKLRKLVCIICRSAVDQADLFLS
jgi:hypothetical protein